MSKLLKTLLISVFGVIVISAAVFIKWAVFSTEGSISSAAYFLDRYAGRDNYTFSSIEGRLSSGVIVRGVDIRSLEGLPEGATLRIEDLKLRAGLTGVYAEAVNGRLKLTGSDTIIINGRVDNGFLNGVEIFGAAIGVPDILSFVPFKGYHNKLAGKLTDVLCTVSGTLLSPRINGKAHLERLSMKGFAIEEAPISFDLAMTIRLSKFRIKGDLIVERGILRGPRSKLTLRRGKLKFFGAAEDVNVDFAAFANIDGYKIDIEIAGPLQKPSIELRSVPELPEEVILLTLVTGKAWRSVNRSIEDGKISADVAKDFVDYFVFNGSENELMKSMGIDEMSFNYDEGIGGVVVKKNITDKAGVKYGYKQEVGLNMPMPDSAVNGSHIVGGSYQLTESISVEGERDASDITTIAENRPTNNDKVMMKYKKTF